MNNEDATATAVRGIFDIIGGSTCGRLLDMRHNSRWSDDDVQILQRTAQQYNLQIGQEICGRAVPSTNGRQSRLIAIDSIDGVPAEKRRFCMPFLKATTTTPCKPLKLEFKGGPLSARMIDLFAPIGKGQRGLIVAPPKAGETTLLHDIAKSIIHNHHDCHLIILLVDERPE
jgi:transcription termination factor Rho